MLFGGLGADTFVIQTGSGRDALRDFSVSEGDRISLDADLWDGARTGQDIVADFGHINAMGRAVFDFGAARLVVWDFTDLASLAAQIDII
jgi:Ca2+-binding RTX toxin-like protein